MDISIIIPTTKDRDSIFNITLQNAIEAIAQIDAQIIVVNDSDGYEPVIPVSDNKVIVLRNPGKGVASARNYGAQNALGELLLFLDNDIIISKVSTKHIIEVHKQNPNICLNPDWIYPPELLKILKKTNFGNFLINHNMTSYHGWHGDDSWQLNTLFRSKSVASFHLSLTKRNFEKSGGYNKTFVFAGFEDYDFPLKLKSIGLTCYIDTRVIVLHNETDKAMSANARLNALKTRAITRKIAVKIGFSELEMHYSLSKKLALNGIDMFTTPLKAFLKTLPNNSFFYKLYVKIYSVLEAVYIYKGYHSTRT